MDARKNQASVAELESMRLGPAQVETVLQGKTSMPTLEEQSARILARDSAEFLRRVKKLAERTGRE